MVYRAGYIVDLNKVQFDEGESGTWIHALSLGSFQHPLYGTIEVTADRVQRFAQNVMNRVRGIDLDIDYDHKERDGSAAGWVKKAEARADGLWLFVEWTKNAIEKIRNKEYRYFSPEFTDEWENNQGVKYKDVLLGGGITNRPFLKDLAPINMSEAFDITPKPQQEGTGMDPKKLRQLLGLPEDATDEQVETKLQERGTQSGSGGEGSGDGSGAGGSTAGTSDQGTQNGGNTNNQLHDQGLSQEVIKLAESNPAIKSLLETVQAQGTQLAETAAALKLSEVNSTVNRLAEKARTKGYALPPAQQDEIRKSLLEAPTKQFSETLVKSYETLLEGKLVQLGENSVRTDGSGNGDTKTATVRLNEAVTELTKDGKMSYVDAVQKVSIEQPTLFAEYRAESYSGRE